MARRARIDLRSLRHELGISQTQLASKIWGPTSDIDERDNRIRSIRRWENYHAHPSVLVRGHLKRLIAEERARRAENHQHQSDGPVRKPLGEIPATSTGSGPSSPPADSQAQAQAQAPGAEHRAPRAE